MKSTHPSFPAIVLALSLPAAHAQSTWTGATSTAWATESNWTGGIPASGANIIIANTTTNSNISLGGADRIIGSLTYGDTGTRNTPLFTISTGANTLTIEGGVNATGPLTGGVQLSLNGNTTISGNQSWTVGGDLGTVSTDRGLRLQADGTNKTLTLDGNLTKEGVGTLLLANLTIGGSGNFVINEGGLKINAASSSLITVGGTGNIQMNNSSVLMLSRNSGTMSMTRGIVMNNTAALHFGGGGSGASAAVASNIAWNGTHALSAVNNNPFDFTGAWSGSGTINRTSGGQTLTVSGNNTNFKGTFNAGSGTTTLSGQFDGATINLSGGTNAMSGSFGASTVNVTGGTNTFSGNLGTSSLNVTGGVVITATSNTGLGTGTVTMSATSGTSRVDLNNVTTGASFVLNSSALTGFNGVITAIGSGNSVINGNVTVSKSQGDGGHLRNSATSGGLLILNGQLNVDGDQTIITHREGVIVYAGGGTTNHILQVTNTARLGAHNGLSQGTTLRLGVSGSATFDMNGFNQTLRALERPNANSVTITNTSGSASILTVGNSTTDNPFSGTISNGSGGVSLVKTGSNVLTLAGSNTYTGATTVSAGTLLVTGALGNTSVTVDAGATFGGTGSLAGNLGLDADSYFHVMDPADALSVAGTISFGTGFGIANLTNINWDALDLNTPYTLFSTTQVFSASDISNFGLANAANVGTGRQAYFQNGSLQIVVIPEPSAALLGGLATLLLLRRRRS